MNLKQIDIEGKLLKLMLRKEKTYSYIEGKVRKRHFSSKEHKVIFHFLHKYYRSFGKRATASLFLRDIKKYHRKYTSRYKLIMRKILKENTNIRELPYYVDEIISSYKARRFLVSVYNANQQVNEGNISKAIDSLQGQLTSLQHEGDASIIREGGYLEGVSARGKELLNKEYYFGKYIGVPSGLRVFDRFYGGIFPGEIGIIVGGTGKGKSVLLLNLAVHATKLKLPVVIVTIEMSKMQYEYRLDSRLTQIEANKFRKKELSKDEMRKWIRRMKRFKKYGKIYIIDIPEGANANLIAMKLREAERYLKTKRYLLVVDYLNLMVPNRAFTGTKNWEVLGEISENLKQLARLKHIPIWTAAQLTKEGAKKRMLTAEDIGYAYKISQDADFGLGLIQIPEMEEEGTLKIVCMKGREGKFGAITCYPDFQRMRINDRDAEDAE